MTQGSVRSGALLKKTWRRLRALTLVPAAMTGLIP
jgi:hypothetical protein